MSLYQLFCVIVVAAYGVQTCNSASTAFVTDSTPASLRQEVEDNSRYKTLEANETMLKLLVSDKNGVSRTEVFDMLHSRDDNVDHVDLPSFPEDSEDIRVEVPREPKDQAELLQGMEACNGPDKIVYHDSIRSDWRENRNIVAFIMVAMVCTLVLLMYATLMVGRRLYLQRNGLKHEQLKNEPCIEETIDM